MSVRTRVVRVDSLAPETEILEEAAEVLRRGGLVAFPTETVYGLGANALDERAVQRLFEAKGRPPSNPVIVHVASAASARALTTNWTEAAERLSGHFWPGPLTLVLPRAPRIPDLVTAGGPTVGLRMPAHPVALALIQRADLPIAAPSANRSSTVSPTTAEHVRRSLEGRIELILDAGPTQRGIESTVVDITVTPPRILRPGPITQLELAEVIGAASMDDEVERGPARSPGRVGRHYAPNARLEIVAAGGLERAQALAEEGMRVGWLALRKTPDHVVESVEVRRMPEDPRSYSALLYATLHDLDALGVQCIVVDEPPAEEAWAAVRDRLRRAAQSPTDPE